MNKLISRLNSFINIKNAVIIAIALFITVSAAAEYAEVGAVTKLANGTMQSLKQQCVSFNRLVAADRTKSLYRLSDMMLDLSVDLERNPEIATDEYLEDYVDSLRLSGVALLDGDGVLEASGYTRQFREANWKNTPDGKRFADISDYLEKIYTERVELDGEYYDVCAVARTDAPGILVGFYHQPYGLINGTESDLESLLSGLRLERDGHYIIAENGVVRVTSDSAHDNDSEAANALLQKLMLVPKDGKLHLVSANGKSYWSCRSGCENYSLYVYYPLTAVFYSTVVIVALVMAAYFMLCMLSVIVRNKTLSENQQALRESNRSLMQTVQMLKALETIYFSLFYVDLASESYKTVYVAPWLKAAIPESGDYNALKKLFLDKFMVPAFRENIDTHMEIAYIRETLNQQNLTDVRKSFYMDYQAVRGDKTPWCRISVTPVDFDEDGNPVHVLALIQDIDNDKAREADYQARIIKEVNEAKIANNAKTEFLRRISHDIRTPINGILGYIDIANKHPEDAELQAHCRNNMKAALHILMELINSILNMGDMETNEIVLEEKPFDLTELLDRADTTLLPLASEKGVSYESVRNAPVPVTNLVGSPRYLSQIIMNLTSNAVKYTKPGGYVRVDTRLLSRTQDTVTYDFICEDNGVGMSEEFQAHMFEPFAQESVTARTNYEGVGLGLSIVKKLVDAMGGTISCRSEKNVGTAFHVVLTFKIGAQAEGAMPEAEPHEILNGMKVLLVEDNELNMEIAECLLQEQGVKTVKAWNGKEAVDIFAASAPGSIDLILMDVMMPEMGGREATRTIRAMEREDAKTVPIIAMSANSLQEDIQKNKSAGMNGYIAKPVEPALLNKLLAEYCKGSFCAVPQK